MGYLLGIGFFGAVMFMIYSVENIKCWWSNYQRYKVGAGISIIPAATISRDFKPAVKPYLDQITEFNFIGDGTYFLLENGKFWERCLKKWMDKGIKINYILIDPTQIAQDKIRGRFAQYHQHFNIFVLTNGTGGDRLNRITKLFETLHPILIYGKEGNGLWFEKHHPKGSTVSYDNKYVPPGKLSGDDMKMFELYEDYINYIKYNATRLRSVPQSKAA